MRSLKKLLCFFSTSVLVLLLLASCADSGSGGSESEYQAYEDSIAAGLSGEVPATFITVSEDEGAFSLDVSIGPSGDVSSFGDYILAVREVFEDEFPAGSRGNFDVSLAIQGNTPSLIRYSSDEYSEISGGLSGYLSDNRSGQVVFAEISSIDDLAERFPAVKSYAEEHGYEE